MNMPSECEAQFFPLTAFQGHLIGQLVVSPAKCQLCHSPALDVGMRMRTHQPMPLPYVLPS